MKDHRLHTLTLSRKTAPSKTEIVNSKAEEFTEQPLWVNRKKNLVVCSVPAWKLKKRKLAEQSEKKNVTAVKVDNSEDKSKVGEEITCRGKNQHPLIYRKLMPLKNALFLLELNWPALVKQGKPQLMAVNIRQEMLIDIQKRKLDLSAKRLKRCLATITRSDLYLNTMLIGAWRKNIFGELVAQITQAEAEYALLRKEQEKAKLFRKKMRLQTED